MELSEGGLVSKWVVAEEIVRYLQKGDLVEFQREIDIRGTKQRIYSHWALFIGFMEECPRIIHFSTEDGDFKGSQDDKKLSDGIGKIKRGINVEVRADSLYDVAGDSLVRINIKLDAQYCPFPPFIIVERALTKLGERNYNFFCNNCEHFVKWCRYGNKISSQAVVAKSLAISSLLACGTNPLVGVGVGMLFSLSSNFISKKMTSIMGSNFSMF